MRDEHVVRAGDPATVQCDGREGIESLGHEVEMFVVRFRDVKRAVISPVAFLNPLQIFFVRAPEGIGNQLMAKEVGVDAAGHLRG